MLRTEKVAFRDWEAAEAEEDVDEEMLEIKCDEETGLVLWERLKPEMRNLRVQEEETEHNLNLLQMFLMFVCVFVIQDGPKVNKRNVFGAISYNYFNFLLNFSSNV